MEKEIYNHYIFFDFLLALLPQEITIKKSSLFTKSINEVEK